ncbi:MAG: hypothetical protein LC792_02240 [Actinobacteria bacterium]|nr:hypothetical protein [Actinomycetota bacterium]
MRTRLTPRRSLGTPGRAPHRYVRVAALAAVLVMLVSSCSSGGRKQVKGTNTRSRSAPGANDPALSRTGVSPGDRPATGSDLTQAGPGAAAGPGGQSPTPGAVGSGGDRSGNDPTGGAPGAGSGTGSPSPAAGATAGVPSPGSPTGNEGGDRSVADNPLGGGAVGAPPPPAGPQAAPPGPAAPPGGAPAPPGPPAPGPAPAPDAGWAAAVPKGPAPGHYTYDVAGTATNDQGNQGPVQRADVATVDALVGTDQHTAQSDPSTALVSHIVRRYQPDGVSLVRYGNGVKGFVPPRPVPTFPVPAAVGRSWAWKGTSTDGTVSASSTYDITATEAVVVGGQSVNCFVIHWILDLNGDIKGRVDSTMWFSPEYSLDLKIRTVSDLTAGSRYTADLTSALRSLTPA